ncbi:unnamed protein product [Chrysoparadoxa australica]
MLDAQDPHPPSQAPKHTRGGGPTMATDFGELALVLGDSHIPQRAAAIPDKFLKMLVPNKMQHVLCTGNLVCKEQENHLKTLAPNVHIVSGDFDDRQYAETRVVHIGQFKIGLIHGHQVVPWGDLQSLVMMQRQLDCDILISGHTHRYGVIEHEGKWFINPGTVTGAYHCTPATGSAPIPSFVLLAIQGSKCIAYAYELKGGEVEVTKTEMEKKAK